MTKFGKLPSRPKPTAAPTTQYDLVQIMVGPDAVPARPFEFAQLPGTDKQYATKYSTSCPKCGHGIIVEVGEPPKDGEPLRAVCDNCKAGTVVAPPPPEEPFRNPLSDGAITLAELDPIQAAAGGLKSVAATTVAERLRGKAAKEALKEKGALELGEEQDIEGE